LAYGSSESATAGPTDRRPGFGLQRAQERLGHSQISLTLDIYSHVLPTMQEEAARKLDNLLEAPIEAY
jgi:integrase